MALSNRAGVNRAHELVGGAGSAAQLADAFSHLDGVVRGLVGPFSAVDRAVQKRINDFGDVLKAESKAIAKISLSNAFGIFQREMEALGRRLERANALLDPENLTRYTKKKLQAEGAEGRLSYAEARERAKQLGPMGGLLDAMGLGGGGALGGRLKSLGGSLAGIGEGMGGKMGGLLGKLGGGMAAAAGPVGLAITAAMAIKKAVSAVASAPFKLVTAGLSAVTAGMKDMSGPLGPIGASLNATAGALSKIPLVGKAAAEAVHAFGDFLGAAVNLAKAARPGAFDRWTWKLKDAEAVVGERFVPVLERLTKVVDFLGGFLDRMLPTEEEVRDILSSLNEVFGNANEEFAGLADTMHDMLIVALKGVVAGIKALYEAAKPFLDLAGMMSPGEHKPLEGTRPAAPRPVAFTTMEAAAHKVYQAAALSGKGKETAAEKTAENTRRTASAAEKTADRIGTLASVMNRLTGNNPLMGSLIDRYKEGVRATAPIQGVDPFALGRTGGSIIDGIRRAIDERFHQHQ